MLPVDCSRPPQIPQPRTSGGKNRKRERITVPSSPGWTTGLSLQSDGTALVGELRNNSHAFTRGVVLGQLDFALALREFPAIRSSYDPNLPEEVGVAHTVEHELGGLRGQGQRAWHRHNDGTRVATIEQQRVRRLCRGFDGVSPRGVHRVANDEVKGNVRLDAKCLGLRGRSEEQRRCEQYETEIVFHDRSSIFLCESNSRKARTAKDRLNGTFQALLSFSRTTDA